MRTALARSGRSPSVSLGMLGFAAFFVLLQLPDARGSAPTTERTDATGQERERTPQPSQSDTTRRRFDRQASERDHRQTLIALGHRIRSLAEIDSMRGLSARDRQALRRRHKLLHPLD